MSTDNIITKNGKTVKLISLVPKGRRQAPKKSFSKKIVKKVESLTETESNTEGDNRDTTDSSTSESVGTSYTNGTTSTAGTTGTSKLKKLKNFNDDKYDEYLTSSNLPNLLADDDHSFEEDGSNKKTTATTKNRAAKNKSKSKTLSKEAPDKNSSRKKSNPNAITRLSKTKRKPPNPSAMYNDPEDVKEKLKFYKKVDADKVIDLALGTRVKYVEILEDGTYKYKPGGTIMVNKAPTYLVLAENRKSWSVQLDKHVIFIEQFELVRKYYDQRIKKLTDDVERLRKVSTRLRDENIELRNQLDQRTDNNPENDKGRIKNVNVDKKTKKKLSSTMS